MTNIKLVEHCKMALQQKWGYVYGTFGTILNEDTLKQKIKQYPKNVTQYESFIRQNWMGKHVVDCVGLIKSYLWWQNSKVKYNSNQDKSANGMYQLAKEKGPLNTIPEVSGILVWKDGHIGVYIGNGQVIESRGTKQGVIQSPLKGNGSAGWTHWCKCPYIEYVAVQGDMIELLVNKRKVKIEGYYKDGTTIYKYNGIEIPLREFFEKFGFKVGWDTIKKLVTIDG